MKTKRISLKYKIKNSIRRKYKKRTIKRKKRTIKQRGGVCPCAIPLTTSIASSVGTTVAATLGGIGLYSLKKRRKKKPKK